MIQSLKNNLSVTMSRFMYNVVRQPGSAEFTVTPPHPPPPPHVHSSSLPTLVFLGLR